MPNQTVSLGMTEIAQVMLREIVSAHNLNIIILVMVHVSTYKLAFCFFSWLFVLSLTFAVEYISCTNCVVKTVGHYTVHTTVHCLYLLFA